MESALCKVLGIPAKKGESDRTLHPQCQQQRNAPRIVAFQIGYANMMDKYAARIVQTVQSVELAVDKVFGDQIQAWKSRMDSAQSHKKPKEIRPDASSLTVDNDGLELRHFTSDSLARQLKFAALLPGLEDFDELTKSNVAVGWKWLAFFLIHMSPYATEKETFLMIGPSLEHRLSSKWLRQIAEPELLSYFYSVFVKFRDIGLNQTETYLFLIVTLLEPVKASTGGASAGLSGKKTKSEVLYRHYADVFFYALKSRALGSAESAVVCRKLTEIRESSIRSLRRIHRHYLRNLFNGSIPYRAISSQGPVTVHDALTSSIYSDDLANNLDAVNASCPLTFNSNLF
ncbi:hypothetical protein BV898_04140 [Hypsibius exemplaris]|uniref:Uncharacterized protein n=1 Tax=Hypsibius exemplaris TaxID=2072580 RepID=A0A1W0X311_HYPEX|nr:hypothetical protein BV898_04140 [Hypsibius exemplaris]